VGVVVPKEHTTMRTKLELSSVVRMKVSPTGTLKRFEKHVVELLTNKALTWINFIIDDLGREMVNKKNCCIEGFILQF
jgi:hypothetical protein